MIENAKKHLSYHRQKEKYNEKQKKKADEEVLQRIAKEKAEKERKEREAQEKALLEKQRAQKQKEKLKTLGHIEWKKRTHDDMSDDDGRMTGVCVCVCVCVYLCVYVCNHFVCICVLCSHSIS